MPLWGKSPLFRLGLEADWHALSAMWVFVGYHYTYFSYFPSQIYNNPVNGVAEEPTSFTNYNTYTLGVKIPFAGFPVIARGIANAVDSPSSKD